MRHGALAARIAAPALAMTTLAAGTSLAAEPRLGAAVAVVSSADAAGWGDRIDAWASAGRLRLVLSEDDPDLGGRRHYRYDQRASGLRVFGAQLVRQVDAAGRTLTVFGRWADDLDAVDTTALLGAAEAARAAEADRGPGARAVGEPELVVLPLEGGAAPAYALWVRLEHGLRRYLVDARTGRVLLAYDDTHTAAAVGLGSGVWGDRKKVSVESAGATFRADDKLRPPSLVTYDLAFNIGAANLFFNTGVISPSFIAEDADNDWADGGVVDAHAYAGQTYDYYFKRHGRRGIDDRDLTVRSVTHFIPASFNLANAFWDPFTSSMFYYDGDEDYGVFSGALDVVAHELTHGVTNYSWNGIYRNESGALNEAFSDIMGTAAEFFHEPPGQGRKNADYWLGEDLARTFDPARYAFRSMDHPSQFCFPRFGCDPDHYGRRYLGSEDNGGVHVNSGIANHAFFLLVEGGTNRTSGMRVAGLGAANRERAERIFYRGFVRFLTPNATFADARAATIQAARELHGPTSNEAAQTAAAWSAVGVE